MKQKLRFGDCYALTKYKPKYFTIRYIGLLVVLTSMYLYARAQQQSEVPDTSGKTFTVTGKVISAASGVAIEGATVANKRTRIHTVTDRLGGYRIPLGFDNG